MHIVFGMNERDCEFSRGTIYNSVVVIGPEGTVLNRHRKLMPTNPERMVWGMGDASGLKVIDTPVGRIATLICWESYMPLARYALYADGVEIYITPTYDTGERCIATMQHIAREGGCWVVSSGVALNARDIPDTSARQGGAVSRTRTNGSMRAIRSSWHQAARSWPVPCATSMACSTRISSSNAWASRGGASIRRATMRGPDIFQLSVNRRPLKPVEMQDTAEPSVQD